LHGDDCWHLKFQICPSDIYKISPPTEDPLNFRYQDRINAVEENN